MFIARTDVDVETPILWSSELNLLIPVHFSLLIPKMSTFTLATTVKMHQFFGAQLSL